MYDDGVMIILLQLNALHGERARATNKSDTSSPPEEARNSIVAKKREEGETQTKPHGLTRRNSMPLNDKKLFVLFPFVSSVRRITVYFPPRIEFPAKCNDPLLKQNGEIV